MYTGQYILEALLVNRKLTEIEGDCNSRTNVLLFAWQNIRLFSALKAIFVLSFSVSMKLNNLKFKKCNLKVA